MSVDLGDLSTLATAIGLVDDRGDPVDSWFADPGAHLSRVLANPVQRSALVALVDELLGGSDATTDEHGVSWLPLVEAGDGAFRLFVTLQEVGGGATVRVGAGARVRVAANGIDCDVDAHVPLFAASGTTIVSDPLLLGKANAPIDLALNLGLPPDTTPGRVALASVELASSVPTIGTEPPSLRLALRGVRMPGATTARDIVVDAESASELDDALLELVCGLVQAQVAALPPASPIRGLAAILGLGDDTVPDLPVADLLARGPVALADWLAAALSGTARQDWMTGLAALLGGTVVSPGTADAAVEVTIGGAPVRLELRLTPGASSRPLVTVGVSVGVAGGPGARLAFTADLVALDLGTGRPVALPRLAITGRLDPPGATKLLPRVVGPAGLQVAVGALEVGFAVDANRRPVLVVTADDADIGSTHYNVLDLSTPDALAAVAGQAVADAASAVLDSIGSAGTAAAILIGLEDPPGAPGLPHVDPGELLRDPVGAVRHRWRTLIASHAAAVPAVFEALKNAVADSRVRATAVIGSGTMSSPWRIPLALGNDLVVSADGDRVVVGVEGALAADLATTGIRAALALRVSVASFDLAAGTAAFLPDTHVRLALSGPGDERVSVGTTGLAASASSLGIDLSWAPSAGVRVVPILTDARLDLSSGAVTIPPFVLDADGRLALDAAGWRSIERLVGALAVEAAARADLAWLETIVSIVRWAPALRPPGTAIASGNASLSLSALVADPATELANFGRSLIGSEDALRTLLEALASLLTRTGITGIGATSRPWIVPLVSGGATPEGTPSPPLPSLIVTLGSDGAAVPVSATPQSLRSWLPGDDGFDPDTLVAALSADGELDDVVGDLVAARGDLAQGLTDLIDRWAATDGLATLPDDGLPTGVTPHRPADLIHGAPLAGEHVTEILTDIWREHFAESAPSRVVFVAIDGSDRHGAPLVLPTVDAGFPADHVIELTSPALPPEAFTPPAIGGAGQTWAIRLGSRTACRLPDGHPAGPDPDGVAGQAARLRRALTPFGGAGADVAIIAHGGAGHAAVRAVAGLAGIRTVITIGTPWSPVSVDSLDAVPSGESLRLLAALLRIVDSAAADPADPAADTNEPDDPDLALARGVVSALLDLDPFSQPLADVVPPGGLSAPAGIPVHAVVGSISPPALRRALTAVVAASLAARARARAAATISTTPAPARGGLRLPLRVGGSPGGISASVLFEIDLGSVERDAASPPRGPSVHVGVDLGATTGWLAGGPDPGRAAGGARLLACRRLSADVTLPIRSWGSPLPALTPQARLVLHEATAFGTVRNQWTIAPAATSNPDTTPLLPEVRAVLGEVSARIATAGASDPGIGAVREALTALGLFGPEAGVDAVTLERLLLDPEATADSVRQDEARRLRLMAALRTMAADVRDGAVARDTADLRYGAAGEFTARLDLGAPALMVTSAPSGTASALPWAINVTAAPAGISASIRAGDDIGTSAVPGPPGVALVATASAAGLVIDVRQRGPSGSESVSVWPSPNAPAVLDALTAAIPALALRGVLDALRPTLASASAPTAAAVDALLEALGLLDAPAGGAAPRRLRSLHALFADPSAWMQSLPAGLAASVPALVDAIRGLLGGVGSAGTLRLGDGVGVRAAMQGPRLVVALDVDASAFTAPAGGLDLEVAGSLGLSVSTSADGTVLPDASVSVGASGTGVLRLRVGSDAGGVGDTVGVTLSLAPVGRPEIVLLPAGPGLAGLADAAAAGAIAALPALLDAVAALDPAGSPATAGEIAGRIVARLGDALALRTGAPARFNQTALVAFGGDPAAALSARAAALGAPGLTLLTEAVEPLLGGLPSRTVTTSEGALVVSVDPVTARWRPGASRVEAAVALSGVPGVDHLAADVAVGPTGLERFDVTIGPASLDAGVLTIAPFVRIATGTSLTTGQFVEVGLGAGTNRRLAFRWNLSDRTAGLVAIAVGAPPADLTESHDPAAVAIAVVGAVLDLAGGVVLAVPEVQTALGTSVLGITIGDLLEGVLLAPGETDRIDPAIAAELADPILLLRRVGRLAANLAGAPGAAIPIEGVLTVRITRRDEGTTPVFGLNVAIDGSWALNPDSDIVVSLEEDTTWITPPTGTVPEGLTVELIDLPPAGPPRPRPGLVVGGLGVRLSRSSGPLLDAGISIGSLAVHLFGSITSAGSSVDLAGGARLELASLGVGLAGASGGDNALAQGVMGQAGTGDDAPRPQFSPAVAIQKHPGQPLRVSLSAGPGSGPWWLTIQREFGPIYLEQIGLAVVNPPSGIESVGILIDGRVSLMGLAAAVDDLSLTYIVSGGGSALDPGRWRVDLAGFAVSADISGITLAGGLRRFAVAEGGVEYLGMLMARVAVYGLTVYGGYGLVGPEDDRYTSLFLFGAVNGPIGGPPAFFVTGIGGGFGINRAIKLPADLSHFGTFPFIKALDPSARAGDPFQELADARAYFPAERGAFWFAAGLSFNSFALVDGIAVVAIQIGGGFELSLLGLARMALPRPEVALVSIELALVARFSTSEGVILVQGQLTDNSWLLTPDVKLTGGFAFATWFSGPNRGQCVVTIGGYHPDFHRDGYPIVPRLGLALRIGDYISIVGESYFALTSEALMAGSRLEISAHFGPAWAHLVFGGDAIVYFDPFWFKVTVYASIDAGVTIDVWIGEITISVHLSARIEVTAPPLHAIARFEVGPVGLTLEFGDRASEPRYIPWDAFVRKYLEEAAPGRGRVLAAAGGLGSIPPSGSSSTGGDQSPDGTPDRPFRVVAEFELTITSTAPVKALVAGGARRDLASSAVVSVAPMGERSPTDILLTLHMVGPQTASVDRIARLEAVPQQLGAFPAGTWGIAPDATNPTVPSGDVISATDRVVLRAVAEIPRGGPFIRYRQVETGRRRLLPFVTEDEARRTAVRIATADLATFIPDAVDGAARLSAAAALLVDRGGRSAADVVAWRSDRAAAPLLGSLGEGLGRAPRAVAVTAVAPGVPPAPPPPRPPRVRALLVAPEAGESITVRADRKTKPSKVASQTTVSERVRREIAHVISPTPSLANVDARLMAAVPARLVRVPTPAATADSTVVATIAPPLTRTVLSGVEIASGRATTPAARARLASFENALTQKAPRGVTGRATRETKGERAHVGAGEVAVLELPDAARDSDVKRRPSLLIRNGSARVVALGPAGGVALDRVVGPGAAGKGGVVAIPPATRSLIVIGRPATTAAVDVAGDRVPEVSGWMAEAPLPSATDGVLVGAGCVIDAVGRVPNRRVSALRSGWVAPDELIAGESAVTTTFAARVVAIAVALEGGTGPDLALGVDGAHRPAGRDGVPEAPLLVADGSRAVLVFRLIDSQPGTSLTVTTGAARRLAGVAAVSGSLGAGLDPVAAFAHAISRAGLAALVHPVTEAGLGGADLVWKEE